MPKTPADLPTTPGIELSGSIWFRSGKHNWGSERRMALLTAIGEEGSISAAAKKIGLSYKAAWDAVDAMNNLAGESLVTRTTGGTGGGGACLTEKARELLELYRLLRQEHERFLSRLAAAGGENSALELIQHMMIQTSARNKLLGTVKSIKPGVVNDEVTLTIADGIDVVATITSESVQNLALRPGKRALAFIKASSIIVGLAGSELRLSARNQLLGQISRIVVGAVNCEVCIELPTGHTFAATLSKESIASLDLQEGCEAYAIFKASSVMLGVLD